MHLLTSVTIDLEDQIAGFSRVFLAPWSRRYHVLIVKFITSGVNMNVLDKNCEFLTTQQAANFLSLKPTTLHQWRWSGRGPKFIRLGTRSIRYRLEDLLNWIDSSN